MQATIAMQLGTCGPMDQWLPPFMLKVATTNNLPLQRSTADTGLDIHHWKPIMAYDGSWSGKVLIQLGSLQELHLLHESLHGKGIEIQQHMAGITVDSLHADLGS